MEGTQTRPTDPARRALAIAALGALYYASARLGLELADFGGAVTPVWAPTGIAIGVLLRWGPGLWPGVALGALLANLGPVSPGSALMIATGNTLEALAAGVLLRALPGFDPALRRVRDVLAFAGAGAGAATAVSATVGVAALLAGGEIGWAAAPDAWRLWWLGDALGALLVAPAILVLGTRLAGTPETQRPALGAATFGALGLISLVALAGGAGRYAFLVLVLWAALALRQRGAVIANLLVATYGVWQVVAEHGGTNSGALAEAQAFMGVAATTSLLLAALAAELGSRSAELQVQEVETERLRASEAQLAEAQEVASLGSWEWDLASDEFTGSVNLHRLIGLGPEELSYESYMELVHPEDGPRLESELERALGEGSPLVSEHRIIRPDGAERLMHVRGELIRGANGSPVRMAGTSQDVSERRQANEQFRALLESAPDAMVIAGEDGKIVLVNDQAVRLFGYEREQLIGAAVESLMPERFRRGHGSHRRAYAERPSARVMGQGLELFAVRKDGTEFPVEISLSPLTTESGILVSSAIRDMTARRAADAALREAEERFRSAFDNAAIGMALVGLDRRWLRVNRALCSITGFGEQALLKGTTDAITHPEDIGADRSDHDRLLTGEIDSYQCEKRFFCSDGRVAWVLLSQSLLRGQDGGPRYLIAQIEDISERKQVEWELSHQALHDPLTGLPNRALFLDRLSHALARRERAGGTVAVLFCDLDGFKLVNDSLGHQAGDALLVDVGDRIHACLRPADTVSRFGGDEFLILCEGLGQGSEALLVAGRVAEAVAEPFEIQGHEVTLTTSIGIALAQEGALAEGLLRDADAAMYRAKERGPSNRQVFEVSMRDEAVLRFRTQNDLRRAERDGELRVHYQPQVSLRDRTIIGWEALVRWQHPERGLLLPGEFISLSEDTGLIIPIGEWVLRTACREVASWGEGEGGPMISVNISAVQLRAGIVERVADALAESGLPAGRLCLEITESAVVDPQDDEALSLLRRLAGLGLRLAIDDYGTGYSALSQIKHLPPIDFIKIDRSFVAGICDSRHDSAIVASVIRLAETLGARSIAEGVERAEQAATLRGLGCPLAQGFYFGRPAERRRAVTGEADIMAPLGLPDELR